MWNIRACVACLSTEHKLYNLDENGLREPFNLVAGLKTSKESALLSYICCQCAAYLMRFKQFQGKCQRAFILLQETLNQNKFVNEQVIKTIDKKSRDIMPPLSFWNLNKCHYEQIEFEYAEYNTTTSLQPNQAPIFTMSITNNMVLPKQELAVDNIVQLNDNIVQLNEQVIKNEIYFEIENQEENAPIIKQEYTNPTENVNYDSDGSIADNSDLIDNTECSSEPKLNEEYATLILLSKNEQKAVTELYKRKGTIGKRKCEVCNKGYVNKQRLEVHMRMHDKHVSGLFFCELCSFYYKTELLLKTHVTEKHKYKYICSKCPEVNFDRTSAKQHFITTHIQNGEPKGDNWEEAKPGWMSTRGGKRAKAASAPKISTRGRNKKESVKTGRKNREVPKDFLVCTPMGHLEPYQILNKRQFSKNYTESEFQCEMCYRGFREIGPYNNHLKSHNPEVSGKIQCDVCKCYFQNTAKLFKHMERAHLFKYSCRTCDFLCYNVERAHDHYKWHNNVTYKCPHCSLEFKKISTMFTHLRVKHPSSSICNICGQNFVSGKGLKSHYRRTHTKQEIELGSKLNKNPDKNDTLYCKECTMQFLSQKAFLVHLNSSTKHTTDELAADTKNADLLKRERRRSLDCGECKKHFPNEYQARKHYKSDHPGVEFLKRFMCDVCGHVTQLHANLVVHMRTHTKEKPYACSFCSRRFSSASSRDRHLVVHTGEKKFECEHCNRRFTQSNTLKLHIQTVHYKIPYAPWNKANRKRRKAMESNIHQGQPKAEADTRGKYLNAYISYHDEGS